MLAKSKDNFVKETVPFSDVRNCLTAHSVGSAICRVMDLFDGEFHRRDNVISECEYTHLVCQCVLAVGAAEQQGSDSDFDTFRKLRRHSVDYRCLYPPLVLFVLKIFNTWTDYKGA